MALGQGLLKRGHVQRMLEPIPAACVYILKAPICVKLKD